MLSPENLYGHWKKIWSDYRGSGDDVYSSGGSHRDVLEGSPTPGANLEMWTEKSGAVRLGQDKIRCFLAILTVFSQLFEKISR